MPNDFYSDPDGTQDDHTASSEPTVPSMQPVSHEPPPTVQSPVYVYRQASMPPPPPPLAMRDSAARARMRRRRVNGHSAGGEWAWVLVAVAMFVIVIVFSLSVFILLRASREEIEIIPTASVADLLPTPIDARTSFSNDALLGGFLDLPDGSSIEIRPWDGRSRFTVILAGLDRRPNERGMQYRTDTMMLISLDPATQRIGVLSIPRDLYVVVPGYGERQRVNTPMVLGELRQPGYGPQLLMQTVQLNMGMRVHDYILVDFNAFITLVDAIGGITIDNPYIINDPAYPNMFYGYDPFYLAAGQHHLNGATALKYARTRHGDSDFQRAGRQQQVVYAVRDRVFSADVLPGLLLQAPTLWQTLTENFYTGLTLEQLITLAVWVRDIPRENISTGVLDNTYTRFYTTAGGASVLIPDQSRLPALLTEVFGPNYAE